MPNYLVSVYAELCGRPEVWSEDISYILDKLRENNISFQIPKELVVPFALKLETAHGPVQLSLNRSELILAPLDQSSYMHDGIVNMRPFIQLALTVLNDVLKFRVQVIRGSVLLWE